MDKTRPSTASTASSYINKKLQELEQKKAYIESLPEKDAKDNRIYNYVTEDSEPYNKDTADGTAENPYIYYCNKDVLHMEVFTIRCGRRKIRWHLYGWKICKVYYLQKRQRWEMVFESVETGDEVVDDSTESNGDTKEVTVQKYEPVADDSISPNVKDVDGSTMPMDYDKSRSWYVFSGEEVGKSLQDYLDELENEDNWNDEDDWEEPEGYTEKELAEAINDKESEVKNWIYSFAS